MSEKNMTENQENNEITDSADSVQPADRNQTLVNVIAKIVLIIAVSLSIYQLYTAGIAALTAMVQRSIHLGAILSLTFILKPAYKTARKDKFNFWFFFDWALVFASVYCTFYICYNLTAIFERQGDRFYHDRHMRSGYFICNVRAVYARVDYPQRL